MQIGLNFTYPGDLKKFMPCVGPSVEPNLPDNPHETDFESRWRHARATLDNASEQNSRLFQFMTASVVTAQQALSSGKKEIPIVSSSELKGNESQTVLGLQGIAQTDVEL